MDEREETRDEGPGDGDVAGRVLPFWFGEPEEDGSFPYRETWFKTDEAFDREIATRFRDDCEHAAEGLLDGLAATAEGSLALIILLDQFPRNLFRCDARSYATDEKARQIAAQAINRGFDRRFQNNQRLFFYLPFEHSENLADQERSVALISEMQDPDRTKYALRHHEIVARFGRFPHRNEVLGRDSTPEELAFLEEPDSSF